MAQQGTKRKRGYIALPGNDTELAELLREYIPAYYVASERSGHWKGWAQTHWERDPSGSWVRNMIANVIRNLKINSADETQLKIRQKYLGAMNIANLEKRLKDNLYANPADFDTSPHLLNCGNGTLDLRDMSFRDASMADMLTYKLNVDYSTTVRPGLWRKWLTSMLPSAEERAAIQTILGYGAFTDGNPERLMLWIQGPSSSGKSTLMDAIGAVLGSLASTCNSSIFQGGKGGDVPRNDIGAVMHKRLIYTSETSHTLVMHADRMKLLVGNDKFSSRVNYEGETSSRPSFLPIVVTNEMPTIHGADAALRRRFVGLQFTRVVPKSREHVNMGLMLAEKAGEEILRWLLTGYKRYTAGYMGESLDSLMLATNALFAESSPFASYLQDHTTELAGHTITNDAAYAHYLSHTEEVCSKIEFGRRMTQLGWESYRNKKERGRIGRKLID